MFYPTTNPKYAMKRDGNIIRPEKLFTSYIRGHAYISYTLNSRANLG